MNLSANIQTNKLYRQKEVHNPIALVFSELYLS